MTDEEAVIKEHGRQLNNLDDDEFRSTEEVAGNLGLNITKL